MLRKVTERGGMEEVTGHWRKLHNEELFDLYSSSTIINVLKLRRACAMYGEGERCVQGSGAEVLVKETKLEKLGISVRPLTNRLVGYGLDSSSLRWCQVVGGP
jgi:hypothetical protein